MGEPEHVGIARIIGGSKISPMKQYDIYLSQQLRKDTPAVRSQVVHIAVDLCSLGKLQHHQRLVTANIYSS